MENGMLPFLRTDSASDTPKYVQLREGLRRWIRRQPEGERLPPERELSVMAGVQRGTLRKALDGLVREGLLRKQVGRGGGIRVAASEAVRPSEGLHPFLAGMAGPAPTRQPLRLVTFENLPHVRDTWAALTEAYRREAGGGAVEIAYLPVHVDSSESYSRFLGETRADLCLLPRSLVPAFAAKGEIAPLPEAIRAFLRDPACLRPEGKADPSLDTYAFPVHFSAKGLAWNRRLGEAADIDLPDAADPEAVLETIAKAAPSLPRDASALAAPWDLLTAWGVPEDDADDEALRGFLRRRIGWLARLREIVSRLSWRDGYAYEWLDRFVAGDVLAYAGSLVFPQGHRYHLPFSLEGGVAVPERGCRMPTDACCLCRCDVADVGETERFFRYLVSPPAQDRIARGGWGFVARRESNRLLTETFPGTGADRIARCLDALVFDKGDDASWVRFLNDRVLRLLPAWLDGAVGEEEALRDLFREARAFRATRLR